MQLKQAIASTFLRKGYSLESPITARELRKIVELLPIDNLSDVQKIPGLFKEIWAQTQNNHASNQANTNTPITTEQVIESILDAVEILQNRIQECQSTFPLKTESVDSLINKQKELVKQQDFVKLEILQHKLETLKKDKLQFENDLKLITQPFLDENNSYEFGQQQNPRKASYSRSAGSIRKASIDNEVQVQQQNIFKVINFCEFKRNYSQLLRYLEQNNGQYLDAQVPEDQRIAGIWVLGLLLMLESTVMILKFCFLNVISDLDSQLLVFLLGMFVLLQPYRPNMSAIAYRACVFSLVVDVAWLGLNSKPYLLAEPTSGFTHFTKPYLQYIWFSTIVQCFAKLIYLYVLHRYQYHQLVLFQQIQKQEFERQAPEKQQVSFDSKRKPTDNYIPNLKEFVKLQYLPK